jgi:hypothetical protein
MYHVKCFGSGNLARRMNFIRYLKRNAGALELEGKLLEIVGRWNDMTWTNPWTTANRPLETSTSA